MVIRVVQNKEEHHLGEVKDLLASSNEFLIASPFISLTAIEKMKNWLTAGLQKLTLITTLKEKDPDQLKKVPILMELYRLKKMRGFNLSVKIDNQLHGKVYIGKKDSNYTGAIVTSANFTENGLENNHEWGFYVNDQNVISDIHYQILEDATVELAEKDLVKMKQWMEENQAEDVKSPTVDVSFIDMIEKPILERRATTIGGVTYWLKPLGKSPHPVPPTRLFGDEAHQITFTTKNPRGIANGDILLAYSVVSQQMISVFEATDKRGVLTKFANPGDERWPNYIWCKNLTPSYGANWPARGLTFSGLRDEFLKLFPTYTILPSGNKLNGMQWGADHIKTMPEFGEFAVNRMKGES
jgi:HKD family nuclease